MVLKGHQVYTEPIILFTSVSFVTVPKIAFKLLQYLGTQTYTARHSDIFAVFDRASHFVFGFAALGTAELLHNEETCQLWITNKNK